MVKKLCVVAVLMIMVLSINPAEIQAIPKVFETGTITGLSLNLLLPAIQAAREATKVRADGGGDGLITIGDKDGTFHMQVKLALLFSPSSGETEGTYVVGGRWRSSCEFGGRSVNVSGIISGDAIYSEDGFSVDMTLGAKGRNDVKLILHLQGFFDTTEIPGSAELEGTGDLVFKAGKHGTPDW
jgi:hypothetical protein